jgi:hypothetical protein
MARIDTLADAHIRDVRAESTSSLRAFWQTPAAVAVVVFCFYGAYLIAFFAGGHDPRELVHMDRQPYRLSHASSVIKLDPHFRYLPKYHAYDGQWIYFIAIDPANARYYMPDPAYRYAKILYPIAARVLAAGRAALVPYTLIAINFAAILASVWILALWLRRKDVSVWYALPYGLYVGTFMCFTRDLTEPLSYALALLAIYLLDLKTPRMTALAAVACALAVLARDKTAIIAAVYVLAVWLGSSGRPVSLPRLVRRLPIALAFGLVTVVPLLVWEEFVRRWLATSNVHASTTGHAPTVQAVGLQNEAQAFPFSGLVSVLKQPTMLFLQTPDVYIPSAILVVLLLIAVRRKLWSIELLLLAVSLFTSLVILNPVYFSVDWHGVIRVSMSTVIAAILCVPLFKRLGPTQLWFIPCAIGWCVLTPFLTLAVYGGG